MEDAYGNHSKTFVFIVAVFRGLRSTFCWLKTPKLKTFYDKSFGYAVFPKITKAGLGIGGAVGKGTVFQDHQAIGSSNLKQITVGFQVGGQQYSEVIFFENQKSFDHFINGKLKFDAQASAVALKKGALINYFDPTGEKNEFKRIKNVRFSNDINSAIKDADLIVIHTEWNDFKSINFKKKVRNKKFRIFDMRNIYSSKKMIEQKIKYFAIGR